jgi:hypothetical protein
MGGSFFELKLTFDDDEKVDVGIEGNNSRACWGSENECTMLDLWVSPNCEIQLNPKKSQKTMYR